MSRNGPTSSGGAVAGGYAPRTFGGTIPQRHSTSTGTASGAAGAGAGAGNPFDGDFSPRGSSNNFTTPGAGADLENGGRLTSDTRSSFMNIMSSVNDSLQ